MEAKPIPDGYHTLTPYLMVKGAKELLTFLKQAFNAKEINTTLTSNGDIANSEILIGNSMLFLTEARGEWKPMPSSFYLYVEDSDAYYQQALKAGGISLMKPENMFYGDRNAGVKDQCGNMWWIATHIEDMSAEELQKRAYEREKNKS